METNVLSSPSWRGADGLDGLCGSSAWPGWRYIGSREGVDAAKNKLFCRYGSARPADGLGLLFDDVFSCAVQPACLFPFSDGNDIWRFDCRSRSDRKAGNFAKVELKPTACHAFFCQLPFSVGWECLPSPRLCRPGNTSSSPEVCR